MNDDELNLLTEQIIGSDFKVLNALGTGFDEGVSITTHWPMN
jgi:hypothetical protein